MNNKRVRRVDEAAEKFTESLVEAYRVAAGRSVSAQELNAQLTQEFFNGVINNLRTQAENNRALADDLLEQQRKQQEASQALTQESVNAYMDFLGAIFAYRPQGTQTPAREAATELGDDSSGGVAAGTDAVRHPLTSWVDNSSDTPVVPLGSDKQAPREAPPPDEESPPTVAREEIPQGKQTP